jgi:1-deoxy-D-xylulose-5-phosphate reductoisomerase
MSASHVQSVVVLGSTGSIGKNTLDVLARHSESYRVLALTAHQDVDTMVSQCVQHQPRFAAMTHPGAAKALADRLKAESVTVEVLSGPQALVDLAAHPDADAVMAAVVGAAGLPPCLAAARAGKRLLLANKEALVVGGALFMRAVVQGGATLVPIDSEHSAIFQCLPHDRRQWSDHIDHIVLTASGGPFRTRTPESLRTVTPDEACAHPNWVMGRKISVDSATMMNKALEVIEARWLFDLTPEQIKVVIHPQSIVHSMVVCRDQSVLAQLGTPDMRVPIAYGLAYPQRVHSGAQALDLTSIAALTFEPATRERFAGLFLSWDALRAREGTTTVLNAANEVAVEAFLNGTIGFLDIHKLNTLVMETVTPEPHADASVESLLALDARARQQARHHMTTLTR